MATYHKQNFSHQTIMGAYKNISINIKKINMNVIYWAPILPGFPGFIFNDELIGMNYFMAALVHTSMLHRNPRICLYTQCD